MAHRERCRLTRHDPVLVTMKLVEGLPGLRHEAEAWVIVEAVRKGQKEGFRIVHFSIQGNHIHFLMEVDEREGLVRGMRGLGCRLARGLNRIWGRKGKVFAERFHERILKSLRQVRNALRYVLNNHRKHGARAVRDVPDPFSSGRYFDGWADWSDQLDPRASGSYVAPAGWKLGIGWRRAGGLIGVGAVPG